MKKFLPFLAVLALAFASLACSFTFNAPSVKTGETQTFTVNEAVPASVDSTLVVVEMGGGKLNITGGADNLIEGTIQYNVFGWAPEVDRDQGKVRVFQGKLEEFKIPTGDIINDWNLQLGSTPMSLEISTGAYEGDIDLSGLSLENVAISDGASQATIEINSVNPVEMDSFTYKTGASQVSIYGLANANARFLSFDGGAGEFTLDFSGELQRDMDVTIHSGISQLEIVIPDGIPATVSVTGGLNNISPTGTWSISGNTYEKSGSGPSINITIDMGVGTLNLISR